MHEDEEGFLYPIVESEKCVDCHFCEKVCPVLNQDPRCTPIECFAAMNQDEMIRTKSSSGGVFLPLAQAIINDGGIVYGACYNNQWEVVHSCATTNEELIDFQGSKYVQSNIGLSYTEVESFLVDGRKVLFSGTPCQVAGLKKFLRKGYENLITIDIVCHGVPSPKIWREYMSHLPMENISAICMKDKTSGWRGYSFSLFDNKGKKIFCERASDNKYMMAFFQNLTLRPSCFNCPAKSGKSGSDITLADFWGIEKINPSMDDNKGTSLVCANTDKGLFLLMSTNIPLESVDYKSSVQYNSCFFQSTAEPKSRVQFWNDYRKMGIQTLLELRPQKGKIIKRIINNSSLKINISG